ncbi:hypothetical protein MTO96_035632 [Rhipicephalus appendiculatus]
MAEPQEQTISEEQQVSPQSEQRGADIPQIIEVEDSKEMQNTADAVRAASADCDSTDAIMQERRSLRVNEGKSKDKDEDERTEQIEQDICATSTENNPGMEEIELAKYVKQASTGTNIVYRDKKLVSAPKVPDEFASDEEPAALAIADHNDPCDCQQ